MKDKLTIWETFLFELNTFRSDRRTVKKVMWNLNAVAMPYWILVYIDKHPNFKIELYRKKCFIDFIDREKGITWPIDKLMRNTFESFSYRQPKFLFRDFNSD